MSDKPGKSAGSKADQGREARLKAALKANLRRRKAQVRARAEKDRHEKDGHDKTGRDGQENA